MKWTLAVTALVMFAIGCKKAAPAEEESAKPLVQVSVEKAKAGDLEDTLAVTGSVSPLPDHEAKITPQVPGKIAKVYVQSGTVVRKGQVLASLQPGATPGQLKQAAAAVVLARETLTQARINLTGQIQTQHAAVNQAELAVKAQQVALAKLKAGSRPQEIVQASANVSAAQASLTAARQALARAQVLSREGLIARKDLEAAQEQERTAAAALVTAQQSLSLAKQGNRPEDIQAGRVALDQASESLRAAREQITVNRAKWQDVRIAKAQLASAEGSLASMKAQARFLEIVSPLSGSVIGRTVNPGENVDVTTVLASVVDLTEIRLLLNVPADKVASIRPGQVVRFSSDASPGVDHSAKVVLVGKAVDPATNTVQVEARAPNADRSLRDDGFVKARIVLKSSRSVLTVPAAAVVDKDGKTIVYVIGSDKTAKAREVEVGIKSTNTIEILKGLKAGDAVVTKGAYELDDGMAVEVGS